MYGEVRSRPRMEPFTSSLDSVVEVDDSVVDELLVEPELLWLLGL